MLLTLLSQVGPWSLKLLFSMYRLKKLLLNFNLLFFITEKYQINTSKCKSTTLNGVADCLSASKPKYPFLKAMIARFRRSNNSTKGNTRIDQDNRETTISGRCHKAKTRNRRLGISQRLPTREWLPLVDSKRRITLMDDFHE